MIRTVIQTASTKLVVLVLGAVAGVLLARALGPEGRGSYQVVVVIATAAMAIGHLSVEQAQIAFWRFEATREALHANTARLGMLVGSVAAVVTAAVVIGLGNGTIPLPGHALLVVALLSVPFTTAVVYSNGAWILAARMDMVNKASLATAALQCSALLALTVTGTITVAWVVVVWTVCHALHLILLRPSWRGGFDRALARRCLHAGMRFHLGSASLFLLQRVDVLLLNSLAGSAAVGRYTVAVTIAELVRLLSDPVTQAALPKQADADEKAAIAMTFSATRITVLTAAGSALLLGAVAVPLIPYVYGAAFAGSVPLLLALLPGLVMAIGVKPASAWLLRAGRPHRLSATYLMALTANVVLNLALIPRFGVLGCAIAASLSYGALAAAHLTWFAVAAGPLRRRPANLAGPPEQRVQEPMSDNRAADIVSK